MKKIVLVMLVGLLVLAGCSKGNKKDLTTDINLDGIKEKVNAKEDFVFVIGKDTCPACISYKEVMDEVINNKKVTIYYLEIIESVWSADDYAALGDYMEKELGYNISGTPTTYYVNKGEVMGSDVGMINYKELLDELVYWGLAEK